MGHTATLLPNGKVLIAGGWQSVPGGQNCTGQLYDRGYFLECVILLTSAELYDPVTGTFASTGSMTTTPHLSHTATLLPDGRVLIDWGSSAELYDPSTETFTAIANMITGGRTATLLANGEVLFTGSAPATVYNPAAGTLVATGAYAGTGGVLNVATLLANGKVLIAGEPDCCPSAARTELYDPGAGRFSLTAPIFTLSESSPAATLLMNGKVLVAGGDFVGGDDTYAISAGLYDAATGTFTATGNMTTVRRDQTATLLPDGTVLIAGDDASVEFYDPATGSFSSTGSMAIPRYLQTATLLPDGRVLLAGGLPYSPVTTASAEVYTPPRLQAAPVLLTLSGDGRGQGAIQHANTVRIASATDPAIAGEYLSIYLTGLADGSVIPPQVAIGGKLAEITFFGNVPVYPGLNVINVRMPSGVAPGPAVPVRLMYLGRASNQVTIGAR